MASATFAVTGYFFARPEISVATRSTGFKPHRLRLLRELNSTDPELDTIEELFRHDPDLAYQLLRYLNSAAFGLRSRVTTIRQAVVYLGQAGLRTWATALILVDAGIDRPLALIVTSVVRGRFCELAGQAIGLEGRRHDLLFLGLFSLIDAILCRPMSEALLELPLPSDVRAAICGERNVLGELLTLARGYERADWPAVEHGVRRLGLDATDVSSIYLEAVTWGNQIGHLG